MRHERYSDHPLKASRLLHPIAQNIRDVHYGSSGKTVDHRSGGAFVTKPTCSTPAAFRRSVTSVSSPRLTSRSPRRLTSFVGRRLHLLPHALLHDFGANQLGSKIHLVILPITARDGNLQPLGLNRLRAPRDRKVDLDAALNHRRRHHEDDEQHEHDVDQRDDVDFAERAGDAAPAATRGPSAPDAASVQLHLGEVPFRDVQELHREVVHARREHFHALGQTSCRRAPPEWQPPVRPPWR